MLELEILVREAITVDRKAASAVAFGEVTALYHKVLDNSMELGALVAAANLSSSRELSKILDGLGHDHAKEADDDSTGCFIADFYIKKDLLRHQGFLKNFNSLF